MSHIDFAIGFVLIISSLFLTFYFISNSIANNINDLIANELKESSLSLERHLFEINDDKSLVTNARELQMILNETNNTDHTEEIRISIKPQVNNVKIYDNFFNITSSTKQQLSGETIVSFTISFSSYETKRLKIVYFGDAIKDIDYLSVNNNITARILSDKEINVVSKEKCSKFNSNSYENTKNIFGFQHQFKLNLDDCSYGPEPPITANVILRNVPVIFETIDGLQAKIARLRIW